MKGQDDAVVVIGAGVAGLSAAAWLAKHGARVTVLEAAPKVGGCCGMTEIGGYRFNDGAQFVMLPQMIRMVLEHLGIDPGRLPLRRAQAPLFTELMDGTRVHIDADLHVERIEGTLDPAKAQADLDRMLKRWLPVLRDLTTDDWLIRPFSPATLVSRLGRYLPLFARSLEAELRDLFRDPDFRSVMAGHLLFAGAPPARFMAPSIIALVSVLADGLYLPEEGMGQIPALLAQAVEAYGGTIHLGATAEHILLSDAGVRAVQVCGLGEIPCRGILSTASPYATLGKLLAGHDWPRAWRTRLDRPRLSMKAFSVQLGLANRIDTPSHLNYLLPPMERQAEYFAPTSDAIEWAYYSVPSIVVPELAPAGGSLVEVYPPTSQAEPAAAWDEARRERVSEAAIAWMRGRHTLEIAVRRVRSPRDFEQQLGLPDGAIYGVDPAGGPRALFPQRTPVDRLYLAGQSTFPGFGVPTAAISGVRAAQALWAELARG